MITSSHWKATGEKIVLPGGPGVSSCHRHTSTDLHAVQPEYQGGDDGDPGRRRSHLSGARERSLKASNVGPLGLADLNIRQLAPLSGTRSGVFSVFLAMMPAYEAPAGRGNLW